MKSIVLINCDTSYEYEIKETLKGMNLQVFGCTGAYNFIVHVEKNTVEEVRNFITEKIRKIEGLRSTLTLAVTTSWKDFDE